MEITNNMNRYYWSIWRSATNRISRSWLGYTRSNMDHGLLLLSRVARWTAMKLLISLLHK